MIRQRQGGQTALEYTILITVVIGAFVAMQSYIKRGMQGRWHDAIDELGDQYDPRVAVTDIRHTLASSTNTSIVALNAIGGYTTKRTDVSVSSERKTGTTTIGAY